jgi:hypothetical protein
MKWSNHGVGRVAKKEGRWRRETGREREKVGGGGEKEARREGERG